MSTTTTNHSTRIALAPVSNSCLNINSAMMGKLQHKLRSPLKKARHSNSLDFQNPSAKRLHVDTTSLLSRSSTSVIESRPSSPVDAAEKLKIRLQLAYYKLRTNQTSLPVSKLDKVAKSKTVALKKQQLVNNSINYTKFNITSTPLPAKYVSSTPLISRSIDSCLLAASTPLLSSSSMMDNSCSTGRTSISLMDYDISNTSKIIVESISKSNCKSGLNLSEYLRNKSNCEIENSGLKLYSFKHGVPKATKSLSLPLSKVKIETTCPIPIPIGSEPLMCGKPKLVEKIDVPSKDSKDVTLPSLSTEITNNSDYKLPSINNLLNKSSILAPVIKSGSKTLPSLSSQFPISIAHSLPQIHQKKISVTPIRGRKSATTAILSSSPTKMISTPSSMGAARSLLQLAFN